jgi:hypothetical protein
MCVSVCLSVCLSFSMFVCLIACLFLCLSICLSASCISLCLSVCLSVCTHSTPQHTVSSVVPQHPLAQVLISSRLCSLTNVHLSLAADPVKHVRKHCIML